MQSVRVVKVLSALRNVIITIIKQKRMDSGIINFWKRFLFRSFVTGCLFYVFSVLVILVFKDTWVSLAQSLFHLQEAAWWEIVLLFLVGAKLILVFLLLVPALALHWCARKLERS